MLVKSVVILAQLQEYLIRILSHMSDPKDASLRKQEVVESHVDLKSNQSQSLSIFREQSFRLRIKFENYVITRNGYVIVG